jgi:hypothetical protein
LKIFKNFLIVKCMEHKFYHFKVYKKCKCGSVINYYLHPEHFPHPKRKPCTIKQLLFISF